MGTDGAPPVPGATIAAPPVPLGVVVEPPLVVVELLLVAVVEPPLPLLVVAEPPLLLLTDVVLPELVLVADVEPPVPEPTDVVPTTLEEVAVEPPFDEVALVELPLVVFDPLLPLALPEDWLVDAPLLAVVLAVLVFPLVAPPDAIGGTVATPPLPEQAALNTAPNAAVKPHQDFSRNREGFNIS